MGLNTRLRSGSSLLLSSLLIMVFILSLGGSGFSRSNTSAAN